MRAISGHLWVLAWGRRRTRASRAREAWRKMFFSRTSRSTRTAGVGSSSMDLVISSAGLLPRQAVEGAQPPGEVHRVDADDRPVAEDRGQDGQGEPVLRVVEGRDEDRR